LTKIFREIEKGSPKATPSKCVKEPFPHRFFLHQNGEKNRLSCEMGSFDLRNAPYQDTKCTISGPKRAHFVLRYRLFCKLVNASLNYHIA